jgi:hypothetical protein
MWRVTILLIVALSLSCSNCQAKREAVAIPEDFEVTASSYTATGSVKQTVYINARGTAYLETTQGDQVTKTRLPKVSRHSLRQIITMVGRVKFFGLRSTYYSQRLTDGQFHSIEITLDGRMHKVEVEAMRQLIRESSDVQRFAKVWLAIVAATPNEIGQRDSSQDG